MTSTKGERELKSRQSYLATVRYSPSRIYDPMLTVANNCLLGWTVVRGLSRVKARDVSRVKVREVSRVKVRDILRLKVRDVLRLRLEMWQTLPLARLPYGPTRSCRAQ